MSVTISKAIPYGKGEGFRVKVFATDEVFQELAATIASRSPSGMAGMLKKYRERQDVIIALQTLAFLQEYCRYHKARYMEMVQTKDEERTVKFDLIDLIECPKHCCRPSCVSDGVISCSRCMVANWCSPDCLNEDIANHELACTMGEHFLKELDI